MEKIEFSSQVFQNIALNENNLSDFAELFKEKYAFNYEAAKILVSISKIDAPENDPIFQDLIRTSTIHKRKSVITFLSMSYGTRRIFDLFIRCSRFDLILVAGWEEKTLENPENWKRICEEKMATIERTLTDPFSYTHMIHLGRMDASELLSLGAVDLYEKFPNIFDRVNTLIYQKEGGIAFLTAQKDWETLAYYDEAEILARAECWNIMAQSGRTKCLDELYKRGMKDLIFQFAQKSFSSRQIVYLFEKEEFEFVALLDLSPICDLSNSNIKSQFSKYMKLLHYFTKNRIPAPQIFYRALVLSIQGNDQQEVIDKLSLFHQEFLSDLFRISLVFKCKQARKAITAACSLAATSSFSAKMNMIYLTIIYHLFYKRKASVFN